MPSPPPDPTHAQPDGAAVGTIAAWVLGLALVVAALLFGLTQLFDFEARALIQKKQLEPISPQLIDQRAADAAHLEHYAPIEGAPGRYQIPITRAMELLATNPTRLHSKPTKSPR